MPSPRPATPPGHAAHGPNFVHSLAKGLEILSAFSEGEMRGNQQLVELTGLPKATVSRLTSTLVQLGYLRIDAHTRKYLMGTRLLGMGVSVQRKIGLQRVARPFMEAQSRETGLTVGLGTRDRLGLVFLEVQRPPTHTGLVTNADAGTVLPLATTAIGLAYLVAAPVKERSQILEGLRRRFPDDWPLMRQNIERAHADYARHGFVTTESSWGRDINGVAVPVLLSERNALYAFNFAGPACRMPLAYIQKELGPRLLAMVAEVREAMLRTPRPRLAPPELYAP
ncbi:transcriptional regulator, IclR family protein [Acidovorax sp. SRB_14]|uniref:IclR family transcriptional regulator n=1 Tax=unclassified Acidovorax TaxID=2684926 RepID=UPI00145CBBC6|nr:MULTISPECIES: IclR family transcriptional regulator [unclassified Acidovorax]NMM75351.1 transcriptional regulator, IclR family protein [Acidovorax sp. SRB_24]NMM81228.1 transcriptional regulator, IclR family protein [Acidovorax sp. SRB_14]NMM91492.1 transcriptional regulator, IclR family protein [Rhodococcus sp. SRB_17]